MASLCVMGQTGPVLSEWEASWVMLWIPVNGRPERGALETPSSLTVGNGTQPPPYTHTCAHVHTLTHIHTLTHNLLSLPGPVCTPSPPERVQGLVSLGLERRTVLRAEELPAVCPIFP